uniref:Palmitoyltransferase n=1 Tax=Hucho hucho TaxID=62062 RepID=A0A4W5Q4B8_9TELE
MTGTTKPLKFKACKHSLGLTWIKGWLDYSLLRGGTGGIWTSLYLILVKAPLQLDQNKTQWSAVWKTLHLLAQYFMLGNITWNASLFVKTSPSIKGLFLGLEGIAQGWRYCYTCETHTPPQCSHCYDSKECVLRRDHHCVLLGQCVGFRNYCYFLSCVCCSVTLHSILLQLMPWIMLSLVRLGFYALCVNPCNFLSKNVARNVWEWQGEHEK